MAPFVRALTQLVYSYGLQKIPMQEGCHTLPCAALQYATVLLHLQTRPLLTSAAAISSRMIGSCTFSKHSMKKFFCGTAGIVLAP